MVVATFAKKVDRGFANILLSMTEIVSRTELQEIAAASGTLHQFGTANLFVVTYSGSEQTLPDDFHESAGTYASDCPFYCVLEDVTLYGREPVCLKDKRIILEFTHDEIGTLKYRLKKAIEQRGIVDVWKTLSGQSGDSPASFSDGVYLSLVKEPGYFHWVTEYATKIRAWEEFAVRSGEEPKILLSPDSPGYQTEYLRLLGVQESQLRYWDAERGAIDSLLVPIHRPHLNRDTRPHPGDLIWLRRRMLENIDSDLRDRFDVSRVYISREDADSRQVHNWTEVDSILAEYGFEKFTLGDMSVSEQVALFSNADIVLGSHGAGLANIVYNTEATVVEFLPSNRTYAFYFVLSNVLGLEYDFVLCDTQGKDVTVDPTTLRSKLNVLLPD